MKTIRKFSILFPVMLLVAGEITFAQTAEELMPVAIQLEEVYGYPDKAIEVYKLIIEKYPDDKPVAAMACVRMGMCYEKLGKQEARGAYRMVLTHYADQEEMVKRASERLAALENFENPVPNTGLMVRKVWEGPEADVMGEPSPDGKYISYVDWETGDLAIYELTTGKKRRITSSGTWEDPIQFAEYSSWSPDGKYLVFDWYHDDNPSWINLYVIGIHDPEPRLLWSDPEMEWAQVYDWSPDGKQVLAYLAKKDKTRSITLINVPDGATRTLKAFYKQTEPAWPREMKFSPDGEYIAYDFIQQDGSSLRDINLLASDGSVEIQLVKHPSNDYFLGWMPDGGHVLFASDRNGVLGAWTQQIQNGTAIGEPLSLKSDMGPLHSMGFTSDGSYYYGIMNRMKNVAVFELAPKTGALVNHQERAILQFEGNNQTPSYSPDGEFLAYVRRFPMAPRLSILSGGNILCVKNLKTGKEREFRTSLYRFGWPRWSPDGGSVLVVSWDPNDQMSYVQIDVQTGMEKTVVECREGFSLFGGHSWSPDGKTVYFGKRDQQANSWNIMSLNLETGEEKSVYQSGDFFNYDLSPDGRWLGLCFMGGQGRNPYVAVIPASGGEERLLCNLDENLRIARHNSITWTVDGKYLLLAVNDLASGNAVFELCRVASNGGDLERLGLSASYGFTNLNAHPDGRHFVYSTMGNSMTEIWVMENIFPERQSDQNQ